MTRFSSSDEARLLARLPVFHGVKYELVEVAQPRDAAGLAAVVRRARQQKLAILRVYSASNIGARLDGEGPTIVIDLSRMNRILAVDVRNATVRVEPGVTFEQLADHFHKEGLPLWVDSERDPYASVTASVFAKGLGRTPYGDHLLTQCGGEFVLPDGSLLRTGMGAMQDSVTWQIYKYALGPYPDGLAVQSGLLVPTQMGIWLMGAPPVVRHFAFDLADDAALDRALEVLRPLKFGNVLPGTVVITHRDFDAARGGVVRDAAWRLQAAHYGLPKVVEWSARAVDASLAPMARPVAGVQDPLLQEEEALLAGRPGLRPLTIGGEVNPPQLTFVAPIEAGHATRMKALIAKVLADAGTPLVEVLLVGRSLLLNCCLPQFRSRELWARRLVKEMGQAGYGTIAHSPELQHVVTQVLGDSPQRPLLEALSNRLALA